jgi:hypothetical protein
MGKDTRPEYRGAWPRIRKAILERDNHLCQIVGPRCTTHATHVDHIIPVTQGGPWWEPTNLRASCQNCNLGRVDRERKETWRTKDTHITLVVGPPYTDKRQAIQTHAKPGDLVIDYDEIASALTIDGSHNKDLALVAQKARGSIIRGLRAGDIKVGKAWILSSNPAAEQLFPYHRVVVVDPGLEQAVVNVAGHFGEGRGLRDGRRLVDEWYRARAGAVPPQSGSRDW